jgi:Ion channel
VSTFRKKNVGNLKDLLNVHHAFDEKSLKRLIDGKSQIQHGEVMFKVLRPADLELDSEERSYLDNFIFRETIFDCECINLRNSSEVNLIDCLVIGRLSIADKSDKATKVYLDTVALTGELKLTGRGDSMSSVTLVSVQSLALDLFNFTTPDLTMMDSRFASTEMNLLGCGSLKLTGNELGRISIAECDFQDVTFPAGQMNLSDLNACCFMAWFRKRRFKPLKFVIGPKAIDRAMDSDYRSDAKRREIETLKFLLEKTEITHNKRDTAQLKYLRSLAESSSWLSRFFVIATGGFIKPWRIILLTAVVIFGFSGVYWHEASSFGTINPICSYWDALYFSGLTFTTIGYGDIVPLYWVRGFAVLEGLLGIALAGAFLVSLTRRYIE